MVEVTEVEPLDGRRVRLRFSDSSERVVDLKPFLWGPAFAEIGSNDDEFRKVSVDSELGTICWANGADLDPDVLHGDGEPVWKDHRDVS